MRRASSRGGLSRLLKLQTNCKKCSKPNYEKNKKQKHIRSSHFITKQITARTQTNKIKVSVARPRPGRQWVFVAGYGGRRPEAGDLGFDAVQDIPVERRGVTIPRGPFLWLWAIALTEIFGSRMQAQG